MKKKILTALAALVLIGLFLPVPLSHVMYGTAEVLSLEKEKTGECQLTVIVEELSSLAVTYDRSFTFNLDGTAHEDFESHSWAEGDGLYQITQMFYDSEKDSMSMCSLVYDAALSYGVIRLDDGFYYLSNGADIPYEELPVG